MAEPLPEPSSPTTLVEPHDNAEAELARRNLAWGWTLFGLFVVLFAGTVGIGLVYLWLD